METGRGLVAAGRVVRLQTGLQRTAAPPCASLLFKEVEDKLLSC